MSYFFAPHDIDTGQEIEIGGEEARHILLSRRMREGETVKLQGPNGRRFRAEVLLLKRNSLTLVIHDELKVPREPRIHIHLFQASTKEKTIDIILQKGTELGVEKIHFFESEHSPYRLHDAAQGKMERWETITKEAAKQCERARWPILEIAQDSTDLEKRILTMDHFYIIDARGKKSLSHMASEIPKLLGLSVGICIGPEGGLSETELNFFSKYTNTVMTHLGPRTLRASTAAPVAIAIIQSILGDMQ